MKPAGTISLLPISLQKISRAAIFVVFIFAGLALAGHVLHYDSLMRMQPAGAPFMRLMASICFLICGLGMAFLLNDAPAKWQIYLSRIFGFLVSAIGLSNLATFLIEVQTGREWALPAGSILAAFMDTETRMALNTAILFPLYGFVLVLLGIRNRHSANLSHILLLPIAIVSYLALVGYILMVPSLYNWTHLGMAFNTAISFLALSLASFCARPDTWLMRVLTGDEAGGIMARRLLPPLLILPLGIGWLRLYGERAGYFGSEAGVSLVVVAYTVCFLFIVWINAKAVNKTDINRRIAEEAMRENEQRLRTILDALPVGIFLSDKKGDVIFTNPSVERIWGLRTLVTRDRYGEYKGRWLATGEPVAPDQWALARTLETKEPFINDLVELESKDGVKTIIHNYSIPLPDQHDELQGVIVVTEDVTERFQAQEQVRIAKEAAEQSAAELERSNEDLSQFAYVASHDLQEPLRAVAGFMSILSNQYNDKLDAEGQEYIHHAIEGAERMQALINDLLTYSRVGTRGRAFKSVNVPRSLADAKSNLRMMIEENDALITNDPLPTIVADASQMTQLLQNLIGNAIKFRGKERPEIHISARREDDQWIFSVRDNGIGMEPQYYDRIFLIFQRLHSRTRYSGTGIGLAVCKKIVERHGGVIWVDSLPGKGSTFNFTIPERGETR